MSDTTSEGTRRRSGGILGLIFGAGPLDRVDAVPAWILSAILVAARVYVAIPFWNAGQVRVTQWNAQSYLFEHVHPLPILSPNMAATITTGAELVLPVLVVLGLFGRFAGLGLGIMAATIFFVIGGNFANAAEQFPWMALGLLIFIAGPGRISIDEAIRRFLLRS